MKKTILLIVALLALAVPALAAGPWVGTITITVATDNNTSAALALPGTNLLGGCISTGTLYVPTIDSGTVAVWASGDGGSTYAPIYSTPAGSGTTFGTTSGTSGTGAYMLPFVGVDFCNFTHLKVETSAEQSSNRTFKFFGSNKK